VRHTSSSLRLKLRIFSSNGDFVLSTRRIEASFAYLMVSFLPFDEVNGRELGVLRIGSVVVFGVL